MSIQKFFCAVCLYIRSDHITQFLKLLLILYISGLLMQYIQNATYSQKVALLLCAICTNKMVFCWGLLYILHKNQCGATTQRSSHHSQLPFSDSIIFFPIFPIFPSPLNSQKPHKYSIFQPEEPIIYYILISKIEKNALNTTNSASFADFAGKQPKINISLDLVNDLRQI